MCIRLQYRCLDKEGRSGFQYSVDRREGPTWFQKNHCHDSIFQCITFHFIAIYFSAVQSQVLNSSTNGYWAVVLSDMRSVSFW